MSLFTQYLTGLGMDISEHHVRIAHTTVFGSIRNLMEVELPEGLVVDEKIVETEALREILRKRLEKEGLMDQRIRTTFLIPESRVFATSFLFPESKKGPLWFHEAIDRAQQDIPIPFDEAVAVAAQGAKYKGQIRTTVYAIERDVFQGLQGIVDASAMTPVAMEANSKALLRLFQRYGKRALQHRDPKTLIGLVDIGHSWATISLYLPDGSNLFSRTLSYHVNASKTKDPVRLPQTTVDFIHRTIEEVVVYFKGQETKIGLFLFAGVEAEDERFKKDKLFYQMGDVVEVAGLNKKSIQTYGAAVGAAMRSVLPYRYQRQHNFISGLDLGQ